MRSGRGCPIQCASRLRARGVVPYNDGMLSVVRLKPAARLQCGGYDLDRLVVELDDAELDFRFELGMGLAIYWALPAAPGDRLRLVMVDGAAFHVDEPVLEADPFVFDLARTSWSGELGQLHDGSIVVRVSIEATTRPAAYHCEVVRRSPTGELHAQQLAWRRADMPLQPDRKAAGAANTTALIDGLIAAYVQWDASDRVAAREAREDASARRTAEILSQSWADEAVRLGLSVAMQRALAEEVPKVAAWDRIGAGVSVVAVAPGLPAQRVAIQPFADAARAALEAYASAQGAWLGATHGDSHVVWAIDATHCQIWHEGELCCLERAGKSLLLPQDTVDSSAVRAVVSFSDDGRRNHRGLALKLTDDTLLKVVEHADEQEAPRASVRSGQTWDACLGRELARALAVPWLDDPSRDLVFLPASSLSSPSGGYSFPANPSLRDLIAACRVAPDDDAPRLAYAQAIGGERGELVVLQCELARGGLSHDEAMWRRRRVRALLDRHGAAWSGLTGIASAVRFERGFVDAAEIAAEVWLARSGEVREAAPLLSALRPSGKHGHRESGDRDNLLATLDRLLMDPALWALQALDFRDFRVEVIDDDGPNFWQSLGDEVASRLIETERLPGLRGLAMGPVEPATLLALGAADLLRLEVLHIYCERAASAEWSQLLSPARLPGLRALHIDLTRYAGFDFLGWLDALPDTLIELGFTSLPSARFTKLSEHPVAKRLERLSVHDGTMANTQRFANFPRLRSLALVGAIGELDAHLTASTMPALRELAYFMGSAANTISQIAAVADRFAAQLELLDLRRLDPYGRLGSNGSVASQLRRATQRMTGVVVRQDAAWSASLLHVARQRESAYWSEITLSSDGVPTLIATLH